MASEDKDFTTLFQDFYPSLCRFLECLLGGRMALAQDLAQESFLQLHRTAWGRLPPDEVRFWLYRVARNFAINEFRKGASNINGPGDWARTVKLTNNRTISIDKIRRAFFIAACAFQVRLCRRM
ncbi:MAG: sigma factor [Pyrinomonadaceae bacterium]